MEPIVSELDVLQVGKENLCLTVQRNQIVLLATLVNFLTADTIIVQPVQQEHGPSVHLLGQQHLFHYRQQHNK